jgi:hypothetical protein
MPMLLQTESGPATATTESFANLSLENRARKCLCAAKTPTDMQTISLSAANRKHKMQEKETAMKPIYQLLTDNDDDATNRACMYFLENACMYFLENARWVQQCARLGCWVQMINEASNAMQSRSRINAILACCKLTVS